MYVIFILYFGIMAFIFGFNSKNGVYNAFLDALLWPVYTVVMLVDYIYKRAKQ